MAARGPRACTLGDLPPSGPPSTGALPLPYRHGTPRGNIGSWRADIWRTPPIARTTRTTARGRRRQRKLTRICREPGDISARIDSRRRPGGAAASDSRACSLIGFARRRLRDRSSDSAGTGDLAMSLFDEKALRDIVAEEVRRVLREERAGYRRPANDGEYLPVAEAAGRAAVAPATIRAWMAQGKLGR